MEDVCVGSHVVLGLPVAIASFERGIAAVQEEEFLNCDDGDLFAHCVEVEHHGNRYFPPPENRKG